MGGRREDEAGKRICIGLLAHVDAGKTTLAEAILYVCGQLRRLGRVDHQDAFLDTYALEKERGITIFSKQAQVTLGDWEVTLLDTPGHVDFSAETERTLQVLDAAILVISGADGVQGHVQTLWRLLDRYNIPVFLFINKMDQPGTDRAALMAGFVRQLGENCLDFGTDQSSDTFWEEAAFCSEELMEEYCRTGRLSDGALQSAFWHRQIFPCFFGSALKLTGISELLEGVKKLLPPPVREEGAPEAFGARVFKITRDSRGSRLTHMRITSGKLKVKDLIEGEKVDQIRLYHGESFRLLEEAGAGCVCAVTGLDSTVCGQGLGCCGEGKLPLLAPVLTYQIRLPEDYDVHKALQQLKLLEEEIPELYLVWKEETGEIHAQVMGQIQIEILKRLIRDRFGIEVEFSEGSIVYKETIEGAVEGIGHFEPLRHYAEVHLLLEAGEPGSGLEFLSTCSEDDLDRNWQRLVLTHLKERQHPGVLIGADITDMRISLVAGAAHPKHTEGGDFRQATYRALRQGLRKAKSVLLEPVYTFILEVPLENTGRAMTDLKRMEASFREPETVGEVSILRGTIPVVTVREYQKEVTAYTRGRGHLALSFYGYEPCHNAEEVIEKAGYDPEADVDNPTGSVFCAHGAGFVVRWDQVDGYAHVDSGLRLGENAGNACSEADAGKSFPANTVRYAGNGTSAGYGDEKELQEIFAKVYGPDRRERYRYTPERKVDSADFTRKPPKDSVRPDSPGAGRPEAARTGSDRPGRKKPVNGNGLSRESFLLVDGYNIIFAWEELRSLAEINLDSARGRLMDILCNYQGFHQNTVILVFDAYKVKGNPGSVEQYHNIFVVYTKEAETADQYIEKTVHHMAGKNAVTVATSDALEQMIVWGEGAYRLSAEGLLEEIRDTERELRSTFGQQDGSGKFFPFQDRISQQTVESKNGREG